jgi:hypothetical protein
LDGKSQNNALVWLSKIGFGPEFLHSLLMRLVKKTTAKPLTPAREECNKYHLTTDPYFRLINHKHWSRWFAIRI